jgi:hypothetical protein
MGLKSHVRRMLRNGTVVPPFVAEAEGVAKGNAVAGITRIAAQRVSAEVGRITIELLMVWMADAMTAVTPSR